MSSVFCLSVVIILSYSSIKVNAEDETNIWIHHDACTKPLMLTPYIEAGKISKAQKLARVRPLDREGKIKSYSGFLTANKSCNSNLFFWFFPSQNDYKNAPVTLWLQGGPGASSLFGLFQEIGPIYIDNGKELRLRNNSWNSVSSLLFIDNPVGTGYSFTDHESCLAKDENDVRNNLYEVLIQFYKMFPDLQKNEFYIFGESYAGKYIPAIAYSIHENNPRSDTKINLKGLGIGDGLCDPENMLNYSDFVYQIGLVDEIGKKKLEDIEEKTRELIKTKQWSEASDAFFEISGEVEVLSDGVSLYNYARMRTDLNGNFVSYLTSKETRCSIHVGDKSYSIENYKVYSFLKSDVSKSVKPWIEKLIESYRILFYNGQFDIIVGYPLTRNFVNKLNWSGADEFKGEKQHPFYDSTKSNVCGYIKSHKNLRLAVVRNAGHMVPADQPECAYKLFTEFIFK